MRRSFAKIFNLGFVLALVGTPASAATGTHRIQVYNTQDGTFGTLTIHPGEAVLASPVQDSSAAGGDRTANAYQYLIVGGVTFRYDIQPGGVVFGSPPPSAPQEARVWNEAPLDPADQAKPIYRVSSAALNVRGTPDPVQGQVMSKLPHDSQVVLISQSADSPGWFKVRFGNSVGWVNGDFLEADETAQPSGASLLPPGTPDTSVPEYALPKRRALQDREAELAAPPQAPTIPTHPETDTVEVASPGLLVRGSPDHTDNQNVIVEAKRGTPLQVFASITDQNQEAWLQVAVPGQFQADGSPVLGWVRNGPKFVRPAGTAETTQPERLEKLITKNRKKAGKAGQKTKFCPPPQDPPPEEEVSSRADSSKFSPDCPPFNINDFKQDGKYGTGEKVASILRRLGGRARDRELKKIFQPLAAYIQLKTQIPASLMLAQIMEETTHGTSNVFAKTSNFSGHSCFKYKQTLDYTYLGQAVHADCLHARPKRETGYYFVYHSILEATIGYAKLLKTGTAYSTLRKNLPQYSRNKTYPNLIKLVVGNVGKWCAGSGYVGRLTSHINDHDLQTCDHCIQTDPPS